MTSQDNAIDTDRPPLPSRHIPAAILEFVGYSSAFITILGYFVGPFPEIIPSPWRIPLVIVGLLAVLVAHRSLPHEPQLATYRISTFLSPSISMISKAMLATRLKKRHPCKRTPRLCALPPKKFPRSHTTFRSQHSRSAIPTILASTLAIRSTKHSLGSPAPIAG